MRTRLIGWLLAAVAVLPVACAAPATPAPAPAKPSAPAPAASTSAPAPTAAPAPVAMKFGLVTPTAGVAPLWVAKDEGIFLKYGIDAELVTMTADLLTPALITGEVSMANMAGTAVVNAALGGADLAFFGSYQTRLPFWFYARPEIASVQDLRGRPVGITGRGGITRRATELALQRHGLDADRDVNLVVTGGLSNSTTSLLSGAVAAAVLSPPGSFQAEDAQMRLLMDPDGYDYRTIIAGIVASRAWVARHEDVARRAMQVVAEGIAVAIQEPERTKRVIARYIQSDDALLVERTYAVTAPQWDRSLVTPADAVRNELEASAADNAAARDARPEQFIENRFADELERSGFIQRLYR